MVENTVLLVTLKTYTKHTAVCDLQLQTKENVALSHTVINTRCHTKSANCFALFSTPKTRTLISYTAHESPQAETTAVSISHASVADRTEHSSHCYTYLLLSYIFRGKLKRNIFSLHVQTCIHTYMYVSHRPR